MALYVDCLPGNVAGGMLQEARGGFQTAEGMFVSFTVTVGRGSPAYQSHLEQVGLCIFSTRKIYLPRPQSGKH